MSDKEQSRMPLLPEKAAILGKCAGAFCHAISVKFNCTAILQNVEEAGSFVSNTGGIWRAEKRFSTKLSRTVEVSVWKDDLTCHKVEAVVNAANEKLNHGGGLAQALCYAGGPMIQKWSDDIIKQHGRVKTGGAVLTPAGKLPCKYIIHAVGPKVSQNPSLKEVNQAAPLLNNTVISILQTVASQNISSVAIPALSSGLFNFPRDQCADIIVNAIKQFHEYGGFQGKNVEVHLVNNDEPSVREMERATRMILDLTSTSASYSGAVHGRIQSMASSTSNILQLGNITLHLKNGLIEEEKADVIVNTIATNCDLSEGEISKAILKKAGRKIQEQISRMGNSISFSGGKLYITNGYGLNCQSVYHIALTYPTKKTLYNSVSKCLSKAACGYKSISFSGTGTGKLSLQKQDVAEIMMEAVADFAKQSMNKLDVYFVVFPQDNQMMEAFEKEMKIRMGKSKSLGAHSDVTTRFASKETTAKEVHSVEFNSVSNEALREAKAWMLNMLKQSDNITIKNNHVIHLDQRDHENLLFLQTKFHVHITEFFRNGNGGITITGNPSDVSCAAIEVESILCKAQKCFARAEEDDMLYSVVRWSCKGVPWIQTPENSAVLEKAFLAGIANFDFNNHNVNMMSRTLVDNYGRSYRLERTCLLAPFKPLNNSFYERTPVTRNDYFGKEEMKAFIACGLHILKMEKLENIMLKQLFEMNRQRLKDKPKRLYQRVSAQFCDLVCRIGFQKEFASSTEQKYGSGIYFSSTVDGAMKLWNDQEHEQYIYIIQAQVLTGKSMTLSPHLSLPPTLSKDPLGHCDSMSDLRETNVILSGQRALPEYLFICAKPSHV
ncbi:Protein mono-ADP-ribosyltransferase PARP9 [Labeo rohita]|uniref:Protein mono-ADP-ribosyltransferase PARP9 n=1 Tax=Labeo rohita TaxID=84645 RepID=A0ABQ8MEM8_LABRO|nr:protein mono-ADP-ribosyltransferase PARP9 [Labeo rohita]KAI2660611.1 Protein mono-ADP-ribosyltransferase PARP9 [Labeo rohita]